MQSAVTVSLVEEARGGPFVFWDGLEAGCKKASELGYDAIEIFPPSADAIDTTLLKKLLADHNLKLAAVGTGAGWVKGKLHLALPDEGQRKEARAFVKSIIDVAGPFGAPAIIGSMQGRHGDGVDAETGLGYLAEALSECGEYAKQYNVPLIFEPLNRYETNQVKTVADGLDLLQKVSNFNVKLLCDLFHMNIEETDIAMSLRAAKEHVGHVHFVDTNRRPVGHGHLDVRPIIAALREIKYQGFLSVEAFPYPNSDAAAKQTISAFRYWTGA
ncbi:MAG: TIM barrel protein [Gemmataceae bacterium]